MATPNLKLLLNALRLGQPQDPKAVAFVLGEAIAAQDEVIEELRRKLGMMAQQAQILEVKSNRLEAEIEALRALYGMPPSTHTPQPDPGRADPRVQQQYSPASVRPASVRPQAPDPAPISHRPPSQPPATMHRSQPPPMHRSQPPPAGPGSAGLRLGRLTDDERHEAQYAAEAQYASEDSSDGGFKSETVVVRREDVLAAHLPEAPFQITPAGARIPPNQSIPGAPWARERGPRIQVPMDEFTIDASSLPREISEDLDGETYATPQKARPRTTPRMPDDDDSPATAIKRDSKR
ncbi:MAG: hypothetical protein HOV80_26660 [Polyangiaceae bacterium]|nr:hypothetical protein [Polyangiaceae bacterium]